MWVSSARGCVAMAGQVEEAGVALVRGGGVLQGAAAPTWSQNKDTFVSPSPIRTHDMTLPHHILRNTATQYDQ